MLPRTKTCSKISYFLEKGGATKIAVFGSYARREENRKTIQISFNRVLH